ncbi:sensor histidine kinase [Galbibacter sp. BG1]|uniref:sensor histidine kinase n=1 Tax=Galbibacter sp. BG1 TaxID=1170699 RepID=UPI0015B85573|nr:sensor histidine kinase [Galbibacter sp. BG1]QLE00439.1 sensor histidine kinase [Galbibacter sp. BG1]
MNQKQRQVSERFKEKEHLILSANYISSILMICIAPVCYFILDITKIIPFVLVSYGVIVLLNTFFYYKHKNLVCTYLITSVTSIICAGIITLYSGGITSPFLYVMSLVVFGGYISTRNYGRFSLFLIILFILAVYFQDQLNFSFTNVVPYNSRDTFSMFAILFSIYLLGAIFGRILLRNYDRLYISKWEIEKKSQENEILLKEIHHRVKNNLQTISSLLNMQARNTDNEETQRILVSSHNRVLSMAIVHEMLYAKEDLSKIEYCDYVQQLGKFLLKSLKRDKKITLKTDISSEIKFNIETAIPLGLLISEFTTNSLKHAFKDMEEGIISISIEKPDPEFYLLTLRDNGVGFNTDEIEGKKSSMGLKLINNLTRQLRGTLVKPEKSQGVTYLIKFKEI